MDGRILFLCSGNSARSIMAEAYMNSVAKERWRAYSAGSKATGRVHPLALETLARHGIDAAGARSKSWEEFAGEDAPHMDCIVAVCDAAARSCPVWPDERAERLSWNIADPAAVEGPTAPTAFESAFADIRARIDAFLREHAP